MSRAYHGRRVGILTWSHRPDRGPGDGRPRPRRLRRVVEQHPRRLLHGDAGARRSAAASPGASGTSQYLSTDAAARSVTIDLIASKSGAGNTFNFNGYTDGKMTVSVPVGWKVTVNCRNQGSIPHSCSIVSEANSTTPVFPGATSPNPTSGVPAGGTQTFSFTPDRTGTFRIACLVPGHEDAGMWDTFQVTASGTPSISTS